MGDAGAWGNTAGLSGAHATPCPAPVHLAPYCSPSPAPRSPWPSPCPPSLVHLLRVLQEARPEPLAVSASQSLGQGGSAHATGWF